MRRGLCGRCYDHALRTARTITTTHVDPQAAREHVARLYATGKSYGWIAEQAGTSRLNLHYLSTGARRRISGELAARILSVPIPEADDNLLKLRALQAAGIRGRYVSVERRYRQSRAERGVPRNKWDDQDGLRLRAELYAERAAFLAQFDAERDEFMRWLYEGTSVPVEPTPLRHSEPRPEWLTSAVCGDCEQHPCACPRFDDGDLWIASLADHDDIRAADEIREAA